MWGEGWGAGTGTIPALSGPLIQTLPEKLPENEKHSTEVEELSTEHCLFQVQNINYSFFLTDHVTFTAWIFRVSLVISTVYYQTLGSNDSYI